MSNVVPLTPGQQGTDDGRGGFFAVEHALWRSVCDLGNNAAIAYLVLARGTGGDNRTTSWSVHAIEKYTRISRPLAKAAIGALVAAGHVDVIKAGSRPRYYLKPGGAGESSWVWLPNVLVDGVTDADPPLERVRQTRNKLALRLLVDMYAVQQLADHGGLPWRETGGLNTGFLRTRVAEWGNLVIWGFQRDQSHASLSLPFRAAYNREGRDSEFWGALDLLVVLGLVELVPHLVDSDDDEAEILHAIPDVYGEDIEQEVAVRARLAAEAMTPEWAEKKHDISSMHILVPVSRLVANVQVVAIARMRYRAKTSQTAQWAARFADLAAWEAKYEEMRRRALGLPLEAPLQHQGIHQR